MMGLSPEIWAAVALSLRVSAVATVVTLPLALGVAWLLVRRRFPGRALFDALVNVPLVLPPVVTGYVLLVAFGPQGALGGPLAAVGVEVAFRPLGAAIAAAVMAFPLMVRALKVAIEAVDPRLEEAAATLGAGRWAVFRRVTLPLALPGVAAAAILGFAKAMGEFGATITLVANIPFQTQTVPSAIYALLQVPGQEGAVVTLVCLTLALSLGALIAAEWFVRRWRSRDD
ncbi:MAG: molybdate ABC transporter permease subunit [Planctomycetota bacterium]